MLPWAAGQQILKVQGDPHRWDQAELQSLQNCLLRTTLPFRHQGHILRLLNRVRIETMVSLTPSWVRLCHHGQILFFVTDLPLHTHPLPNSKAGGSTLKMNLVWPGSFNCSPIKCIDLISSFDILLFLIVFLGNYWDRWLTLAYGRYQGFYT